LDNCTLVGQRLAETARALAQASHALVVVEDEKGKRVWHAGRTDLPVPAQQLAESPLLRRAQVEQRDFFGEPSSGIQTDDPLLQVPYAHAVLPLRPERTGGNGALVLLHPTLSVLREKATVLITFATHAGMLIEHVRLHLRQKETLRALQAMDREKAEFLAMVSHELQSPVAAIQVYARLLNQELLTDHGPAKAHAARIAEESHRLARLIEDLVSASLLASTDFPFHPAQVDLFQLVREAAATLEHMPDHHVVRVLAPERPIYIKGDQRRLSQVLCNLLSNARKYSPPGSLITVSVAERPEQHEVHVSVEDQGMGIAPDNRGKLFTKFGRIQTETTQQTPGTGLGLYISKLIVERHGGRIWAESAPGKGSRFTFALPLQEAPTGIH
jgi:signal transduction histidine kinase